MSNRTRTLIIGAMLAAMHLVGMTAVAHAQASDQQATLRPPTERQVGEAWRHRQVASQDQIAADAAIGRVQARERFSIPNATPPGAGPSARRVKQAAGLALNVAGGASCRPGAGGRTGRPSCQANQEPGSA
jgi:hypothetical protein